jgi:hypothetical protein
MVVAAYLGEHLGNVDDGVQQIDAAASQPEQLPGPQPSVPGDEDEGRVMGLDGVGEHGDLVGGEEPHFVALDARQRLTLTRRDGEQPGIDRRAPDLRQQLVRLRHRGGRVPGCRQSGDPLAHVDVADRAQRHGAEHGLDVGPVVRVVARSGRRPQVHRGRSPPVGPFGEQDAPAGTVDVGAAAHVRLDFR